jgi:hypothetical protein
MGKVECPTVKSAPSGHYKDSNRGAVRGQLASGMPQRHAQAVRRPFHIDIRPLTCLYLILAL